MAIGVHSTQNDSIVSGGVGDDDTDNQYRQPIPNHLSKKQPDFGAVSTISLVVEWLHSLSL